MRSHAWQHFPAPSSTFLPTWPKGEHCHILCNQLFVIVEIGELDEGYFCRFIAVYQHDHAKGMHRKLQVSLSHQTKVKRTDSEKQLIMNRHEL